MLEEINLLQEWDLILEVHHLTTWEDLDQEVQAALLQAWDKEYHQIRWTTAEEDLHQVEWDQVVDLLQEETSQVALHQEAHHQVVLTLELFSVTHLNEKRVVHLPWLSERREHAPF